VPCVQDAQLKYKKVTRKVKRVGFRVSPRLCFVYAKMTETSASLEINSNQLSLSYGVQRENRDEFYIKGWFGEGNELIYVGGRVALFSMHFRWWTFSAIFPKQDHKDA
jgi:hypothetical protein